MGPAWQNRRSCRWDWPRSDQTLPAGGLACGAVHEASGSAVGGFAAWLAGRLVRQRGGAVLWCVKPGGTGQLYGPGLEAFGLDVGGLIIVRSRRRADMLWVMEESLRLPGVRCRDRRMR